jgi:hypothetical protein
MFGSLIETFNLAWDLTCSGMWLQKLARAWRFVNLASRPDRLGRNEMTGASERSCVAETKRLPTEKSKG